MPSRNRLSGAVCDSVALKTKFLNGGIPTDPAALCSVQIYKCSVTSENLVTEIVFPSPTTDDFDLSNEYIYGGAIRRCGDTADDPLCGTDAVPQFTPGCFVLELELCPDLFTPGVYFDVWNFVGTVCDPCIGTDVTDVTDLCADESNIQSQCNKFFVNDRGWFITDCLKTIDLGFEPLDKRFQQPEKRFLEVGLTPLPLYDFNVDQMNAIIPALQGTITILTQYCEVLVDSAPMEIGLRNGSYRSNPYVLKYLLDSSSFLKGTYQYRVDVQLPDGQTRSSTLFTLAIR